MKGYQSAPDVMIGIGVFLILTGIFGFFAIAKGNTCMLRTVSQRDICDVHSEIGFVL